MLVASFPYNVSSRLSPNIVDRSMACQSSVEEEGKKRRKEERERQGSQPLM